MSESRDIGGFWFYPQCKGNWSRDVVEAKRGVDLCPQCRRRNELDEIAAIRTIRPVTIEAGVVAGRAGFAALVTPQRRNVVLFECARDGSDLRRIDLGRCRVRHYRCAPHDAGSQDKIVERVTLHPGRLRITSLANGDYVAPNPVGEIRARVLFAEAQQQRPPEGSSSSK